MSRRPSTSIVMFSLNYADRLQRALPYVPYSAERSLCHLASLSDPDTRVVVLLLRALDPRVLDYQLDELCGRGAATDRSVRDRLSVLVPADVGIPRLDTRVLADEAVMDRLREEVRGGSEVTVVNFAASPAAERLAATLGVRLEEGNNHLAVKWGGKIGGKEVLRRAGVPMPRGGEYLVRDEREVVAAVRALGPVGEPRRAMLKLDDPSWGGAIGNCLLDRARLLAGDVDGAVETGYQPWPTLMGEVAAGGAVVEEYLEDVVASPSGTGHVGPDGRVRVVATHDQIIKGGQYWGCAFPAADGWRTEVAASVERVGGVLAALGVRGTFGVDFIAVPDGRLLACEINLRKIGSSHVVATVEALVGAPIGAHGRLTAGPPVHYVHRRLYQPDALRGVDPMDLVDRLRDRSMRYAPDRRAGTIFHMLGAVSECGYVELTSVAGSAEQARALDERACAEVLARA